MASTLDAPADRPPAIRLFALIFLPFATGYFFSYLYRTVNAVIGPDLAVEMALTPGQLGLLTSAYFITFAAAQIPVGLYLDSHGPRRVVTVLLLIAALGAFLFSIGEGMWSLLIGRALIGLGVAACLMGSFKAMVEWFPKGKLPLMNGLIVAFGGLGAIFATAPTEALVSEVGWRSGFIALALATLLVAAAIWFLSPERERSGASETVAMRFGGLMTVFRSGLFWRIAPLAALSQGSFLAIQTLWAGPWLRDIAGLDSRTVSFTLLAGAAGFVAGNLIIGFAAERLDRRGIAPIVTAGVGMGLFILVQFVVMAGWADSPVLLWLVFGATGTTGVVCFAVISHAFPADLAGRASTALNLMVFGAAFALQWGMGEVINIWPTGADGSYAAAGYQAAFGIALALQIVAFAWMLIRRPQAPAL
ncbi:MAG: MFS transporter [Alphaproteobacteria bacterium]|nr:MFS transporter [Alphaproteobacteria bacterium]